MDIEHSSIDFKDGTQAVFGLNITKKKGRTSINIFDLDENRDGAKIGDHLWELREHILQTHFKPDEIHDFFRWNFTTGYATTDLTFFELNQKPCQLIVGNIRALQIEQLPGSAFSSARYSEEYLEREGEPVHQSDLSNESSMSPPKEPDDAFAIPCQQAKGGVFYCKPEFYLGNIHDDFEYMLVDTQKLLARIKQDDPEMLEHAKYKFAGETPEDWVQPNSPGHPYNTGSFTANEFIRPRNKLSPGLGITLSSGNAGMFILADKLKLPFIPIAIDKGSGAVQISVLKAELGYANDIKHGPSFDKHEVDDGFGPWRAAPVVTKSSVAGLRTLENSIQGAEARMSNMPVSPPPFGHGKPWV